MVASWLVVPMILYLNVHILSPKIAGQWLSKPELVRVCLHDDAIFNWTYDTSRMTPPSVIWWFELDNSNTVLKYNMISGKTTIFHPEYEGRTYMLPGSNAGLVLLDVTKSDERGYRVEMSGLGDSTDLFVHTEAELIPSVSVDGEQVTFNSFHTASGREEIAILVRTQQRLTANISIHIIETPHGDVSFRQTCSLSSQCVIHYQSAVSDWLVHGHVDYGFCPIQYFNLTITTKPEIEKMLSVDINGQRVMSGQHWHINTTFTETKLRVNITGDITPDINIILAPGGRSYYKRCLSSNMCVYDVNHDDIEEGEHSIPVEISLMGRFHNTVNFTLFLDISKAPPRVVAAAALSLNRTTRIILGVTCSVLLILMVTIGALLCIVTRVRRKYTADQNKNLSMNTEMTTFNTFQSIPLDKATVYDPLTELQDETDLDKISSPPSQTPSKRISITFTEVKRTGLSNKNINRDSTRASGNLESYPTM